MFSILVITSQIKRNSIFFFHWILIPLSQLNFKNIKLCLSTRYQHTITRFSKKNKCIFVWHFIRKWSFFLFFLWAASCAPSPEVSEIIVVIDLLPWWQRNHSATNHLMTTCSVRIKTSNRCPNSKIMKPEPHKLLEFRNERPANAF